ncbi:alcohol dehydrogenase catalytic domain-containing protein [Actinomycetospora lemnae]|uniref:Alcohol dehydrogenase catalytic domain-containing protein n=1 Tax=Actinomycetospora lemnae TaxID=3019891 RepID=A0ABT5SZP8_9PSEU|nr:alcohol dehydrogenase catalytic domain-containing protein [Actinomycetospora sp. DW7H6]MDD7967188.1 alcohol dehydrogenase catalytic domain-containing protein [Actinomycetospora sp. DW7H6]
MTAEQRVAVLQEPEHMTVETRPVPEPGPGEVQVAVRAVSVCGSDVHYYDHGRIGGFVMHAPLVLGHETSGVVSALGEGVEGPAVGTRVAVEPQRNCGRCTQCVRGRYHLCPWIAFFATPPIDGSFAQYVVVPATRAHPVPDALSEDAAAMIEPLAVAVHAAGKAEIGPDVRVFVSGAGPVGLLCLQVARARGAAHVTVSDPVERRRAKALEFGADAVVDPAAGDPGLEPVDVVLECTGVQAAVDLAIAATAPAATVVLVGTGERVTLPLDVVQARELVVKGTFRYAHVYPAAIALAASGAVRLDDMVTSHHDLDAAEDALLAARRDPAAIKAVVRPG